MALETPDLAALTSNFVKFGGSIFRKKVNAWDMSGSGVLVMSGIKQPTSLTKLSAKGNPRPYRAQQDATDNGAKFTDRIITVNQSKWDFILDPELYRNTYLADVQKGKTVPFYEDILGQLSDEYMAFILPYLGYGVYNSGGSAVADILTGWLTILSNEMGSLTPVTTGAINSTNAVAKVQQFCRAVYPWMRKMGFRVKCSHQLFDEYAENYASEFTYQFQADATGRYRINNFKAFLEPEIWMDDAPDALIGTIDNNLVLGTDASRIEIHPTQRMNLIDVRMMMPVGAQIQDLDAIVVNDQI